MKVEHSLAPNRGAWVQVVRGAVKVDGELLRAGDAAAVEAIERFTLEGVEEAELLVFDLA